MSAADKPPAYLHPDPMGPCDVHPEGVTTKTIGGWCDACGHSIGDCWIGYLRWERRKGIDLNRDAWSKIDP